MKTDRKKTNRAKIVAFQPVIWLTAIFSISFVLCVFAWYMRSAIFVISMAVIMTYSFIRLAGSFSHVRVRIKMYELFTDAIPRIGFDKASDALAKHMNSVCGRYVARMIVMDTDNYGEWKIIKSKAALINRKRNSALDNK